jgi:hypothetical protein
MYTCLQCHARLTPCDLLHRSRMRFSEYDPEHDSGVHRRKEDDVDALDSLDLHSDVDMERDGDNEEEQDEEEQDENEEDEDEDDGKEPRTIGPREMVNTLHDDVDIRVDDRPMVLLEQGQEMSKHTPQPQLPVPAPWPKTPQPCPLP